jgi:Zn-finger nucleic acid-binding protein
MHDLNMNGVTAMKCPIDGNELRITDRQGIEIDYCPQCRGVWLDRGELDKLIERSATLSSGRRDDDDDDDYRRRDNDSGRRDDNYRPQGTTTYPKKKKRGGFLEDLFDFG